MPLPERIALALTQVRGARKQGEHERELAWTELLDRLLDRYEAELRAADAFRPLSEIDPELYRRVSVDTER